jgi:hypothetical protein
VCLWLFPLSFRRCFSLGIWWWSATCRPDTVLFLEEAITGLVSPPRLLVHTRNAHHVKALGGAGRPLFPSAGNCNHMKWCSTHSSTS